MTIQLHKCAHFVFCIKNFVDLDACKQLFVLNLFHINQRLKKPEVKKKNQ